MHINIFNFCSIHFTFFLSSSSSPCHSNPAPSSAVLSLKLKVAELPRQTLERLWVLQWLTWNWSQILESVGGMWGVMGPTTGRSSLKLSLKTKKQTKKICKYLPCIFLTHVYFTLKCFFQSSSSAVFLSTLFVFISIFKWISYEWWIQKLLAEWI